MYEHYVPQFVLNRIAQAGKQKGLSLIQFSKSQDGRIFDVRKPKSVPVKRTGGVEDYTRNLLPRIDPAIQDIERQAAPALSDLADGRRLRVDRYIALITFASIVPLRHPDNFQKDQFPLDWMTSRRPVEPAGYSALILRSSSVGTFVNLKNPEMTAEGLFITLSQEVVKKPGTFMRSGSPNTVLLCLTPLNGHDFLGLYLFEKRNDPTFFYRTVVEADWRHIRKLLYYSTVVGEQSIVVNMDDRDRYHQWLEEFAKNRLHGLEPLQTKGKNGDRRAGFFPLKIMETQAYSESLSESQYRWFEPVKTDNPTNHQAVRAISGYLPGQAGGIGGDGPEAKRVMKLLEPGLVRLDGGKASTLSGSVID